MVDLKRMLLQVAGLLVLRVQVAALKRMILLGGVAGLLLEGWASGACEHALFPRSLAWV